jgi:UDP-glucose 4-epimerase
MQALIEGEAVQSLNFRHRETTLLEGIPLAGFVLRLRRYFGACHRCGKGFFMKVLITGGAGFIGTNLVARLRQMSDVYIRILDNETLGRREHLDGFDGEFIRGDITDRDALDRALEGMNTVVHLAADTRVMDSIINPAFNFAVNAHGTFSLLEAMRARGIKRLVNASTGGAILGEAQPPVHEEMVPRPLAPYGASKLTAEGYCSAYAGSYDFKALSLRFSNVYGPRSFHKGSVVAAFLKRVLMGEPLVVYGDGSQTRDFVFVDDLCQGIFSGMTADATGVIQLGSGQPFTVNKLIEEIRLVVAPRPVEVRYEPARRGEVHTTWCDIAKARRKLGFDPVTQLEEGLARTWRWFLDRTA